VPEGDFAIKLTAMISIDIMTKLSSAQKVFTHNILKFAFKEPINADDIKNSLTDLGIGYSEEEIQ
jgi:hypothetical protein